jgi:hypothetical protein
MVDLQFQWGHWSVEVNTVQVVHQQDLAVTFSAISRFGPFCGFPNLDYDNISIGGMRLSGCKPHKRELTEQHVPQTRRDRNTLFRS